MQYTWSSLHPTRIQLSTTTGDEKMFPGSSKEPSMCPHTASSMYAEPAVEHTQTHEMRYVFERVRV